MNDLKQVESIFPKSQLNKLVIDKLIELQS